MAIPVAAMSSELVVAEAQERLRTRRTSTGIKTIERLKTMYDLGDEVELAMRMLTLPNLTDLASNLMKKVHLRRAPEKNTHVMEIIQNMDPDVEVLVTSLKQLDAGGEDEEAAAEEEACAEGEDQEAASEEEDSGEVVARAQARLTANKGKTDVGAIQRLKADCGLADEVELALRMLGPEHLREVLAGWKEIKRKCIEKQDGGKFMLTIISALDPEASQLMRALLQLDEPEQAEQEVEQAEPVAEEEAQLEDGDVLRKARGRLDAPKSKVDLMKIQRLKVSCNLGDEIELALQMLSPQHLREMLAGEDDIRQRMRRLPDAERGAFMLKLIRHLDPEVEMLVNKLMEIEREGAEEEEEEEEEQQQQQPDVAPEQSTEEAVAEAQERIHMNENPANMIAIQNFRTMLGLGDEVELALRMLDTAKLWKVLSHKMQLRSELLNVEDKNRHVLRFVSQQDPKVEVLVRKFMEIDGEEQAEPSVGRSRSPKPLRGAGLPPARRPAPPAGRPPHLAGRPLPPAGKPGPLGGKFARLAVAAMPATFAGRPAPVLAAGPAIRGSAGRGMPGKGNMGKGKGRGRGLHAA